MFGIGLISGILRLYWSEIAYNFRTTVQNTLKISFWYCIFKWEPFFLPLAHITCEFELL